ncbi:regulatory protein RecX [Butyrivibrio sp. LB2008]|jgi:regulatory protein|uniref:regulatory protein RecX n=1 Tax=Butyrivibrio sp. LB2008 TaxID=1408305 RepID=UPI00047E3F08|nr:regulatory protein RecX [Butyrivibrio sp. LB2008]
MIISDICALDKKRSKVFIDGEFAFVLYNGELRDFDIKVGNELSDNKYDEIKCGLLPKRAKLRAMNLLQKKDYTEKQLRDKLSDGLYPEDCIDTAIDYVKSYRYLDDERYACDYITYHMSVRSKNRIIMDLMNKGISKDIIHEKLEELYSEEGEDIEISQIKNLLIKKKYDAQTFDHKEKQKLIAFLMRRGYDVSAIKKAMDSGIT